MKRPIPKPLDHIVLPVPSLKVARARYESLGFTVAPDGRHRFGTENCCVKFSNGSFIEPLAIGHRETVEANALKGNSFLRRDAAYRFRHGDNGFWGLSLTSDNSRHDRKAYKKAGYNTGKLVTVKRKGVHAKVAFAMDERAPDFSIFSCQDVNESSSAKVSVSKHDNTAIRIRRVTLCEQLPEDFQYYLQETIGQRKVRSHSFGMEMELPNAFLSVLNYDGMRAHYGISDLPLGRGLRAMAFDIEVQDIEKTKEVLKKYGIEMRNIGHRIIVDPVPGQGAVMAFVEKK